MKRRANTLLQNPLLLQASCRGITQSDGAPLVAYSWEVNSCWVASNISSSTGNVQLPLLPLASCCKLVKTVCLQATLTYPRVSVRHSTNHRSRKRLAWFLLLSPNPQLHFVLSDNGRSTEPEAETPGQCKHCCKPVCGSSWLWVSGKQRQAKGKGNRKRIERTMHNAVF